ncbi:MAG: hypothetical protein GY856_01640 [bacterium]|nr:hypothetical protein [bacterium]
MTDSPTSAAERHAELSDSQLVSRLVELDTPALTAPLHAESLLDLLWISMEELRRYFYGRADKVLATRELVADLARAELAREVLADPAALARLLFFAHSCGDCTVTGAAFIDRAGGLSDHRDLFEGSAADAKAAVREMIRLALVLEASILVFHVRADGDCTPAASETELHAQVSGAAELLDVPVVDSWVVAGPRKWSPLIATRTGEPAPPANQDLPRRRLTAEELKGAEIVLGTLLRDSSETDAARRLGRERARVLLAQCGGVPGLAATPADELSCPGLPQRAVATVAAALELARRLRQLEVARPRSESESKAAVLLHRFARGSGEIHGVIFTGEYGKMTVMPAMAANGSEGAVFLNRWLLSQAVLTCATRAQPFTFTADAGEPGAADEESEFGLRIAKMRPFFDFEILDHLRVFGDGRWCAGCLCGRLPAHLEAALVTSIVPAGNLWGKAAS